MHDPEGREDALRNEATDALFQLPCTSTTAEVSAEREQFQLSKVPDNMARGIIRDSLWDEQGTDLFTAELLPGDVVILYVSFTSLCLADLRRMASPITFRPTIYHFSTRRSAISLPTRRTPI